MQFSFAAFSEQGPRATNEDRFLEPVLGAEAPILAIADGMGGATGGGDAASLAIDAVRRIGGDLTRLDLAFADTVDAINRMVEQQPEKARMGTTLSVAAISGGELRVAHVGDTRIYHLRKKGLNSLTQDQTEIAELVRRGVFTEGEARRYPRRNVLISALTASAEYEIFHRIAKVQAGDRILMTSDGVHQKVTRGSIIASSLANADLSDFIEDIKARVSAATPSDNYTALALEIISV